MAVGHSGVVSLVLERRSTDRSGGVSAGPYAGLNLGAHVGDDPAAVAANRAELAARCGLSVERLVFMRQVHGREVAVVDGPLPGEVQRVDALVTAQPELALVVVVADCVPVLLGDPVAGVVAVAHAGRPGVALGVVPATVEAMVGLGAMRERIEVQLGPSVCGNCYEVPGAMQDAVAAVVPQARSTTRSGTAGLDLRAGVIAQLAAAGVPVDGEPLRPVCTLEDPSCFSYRRDGVTGRQAGVVWLTHA